MSDPAQAPTKLSTHVAHLCRLSATFLFIFFVVGCIFTILGRSTDNFLDWQVNFTVQLMERSHLPLIGIALYALSITANDQDQRTHHASTYWKGLIIISALGVMLYLLALAYSSRRAYLSISLRPIPAVSYEENLKLISAKITELKTKEETSKILEDALKRSGKTTSIEENESIEVLKNRILKEEKELLLERYESQQKNENERRRGRISESIRYVIYSFLFIIFYFNLLLFFNRLHKSSWDEEDI